LHLLVESKDEYDDARKDNELIHSKPTRPESVKIVSLNNNQNIIPVGDVTFTSIFPFDSYILCFSYAYDEKFYGQFDNSDSFLTINDTVAFQERLYEAFLKKLPRWHGMNARVTYSKHESAFGVLFSKHKNYLYQRKYRFSWVTETPKRQLNIIDILNSKEEELKKLIPEPISITIGSL